MTSKVFFKRLTTGNTAELSGAARALLERLVAEENHVFAKQVPLKVHFGEAGNTTFVPPSCYDGVIDYLEEHHVGTAFIETNVLYRGARTTEESHRRVAAEHGFTRIPVIIADGAIGTDYSEIPIHREFIDTCKIGIKYADYDQFLVMSHFKGHDSAGFGGALKQLSMGFAARGGKLEQHSGLTPIVNEEKCVSCGQCVSKCGYDSIALFPPEKAHILTEQCVGCAGCIAVCPIGAIYSRWDGNNLLEKIAEYAYGAQLGKDNIYISFAINITKSCDCLGEHMIPVAGDVGVFASKNPVALDTACLDMLQHNAHEPLFDFGRRTLEHAVKIGFARDRYDLIHVD